MQEIPKTNRQVLDDALRIQKNAALMQLFDDPQNSHPAIHVAGTSGKGTVCYLVDAILRAHTKKTGMVQSPHVYDIRERIQTNGQLVSEKNFLYVCNAVLSTLNESDMEATFFETLTIMGFIIFGRMNLDYTVIETGLGGRLDATNTITRKDKLCVITRIGLDHTNVLGDTLEKIATEKVGIIQQGNHVIALRQEPEITTAIEKRVREQSATVSWIEQSEDYQVTNDRLAVAVCEFLAQRDGWELDHTTATATLQQVFIPGRFEKRHFKNHLAILDGAHNPQKLAAMVRRVQSEGRHPVTVILSLGERKDVAQCLRTLQPIARRIIATEYFTKESHAPVIPTPVKTIATMCTQLGISSLTEINPRTALQRAAQFPEPIVVTGSFYLLGEVDGVF